MLGFVSWRTVFVVVGVKSLVLAVLAWKLVKDTPREVALPTMRELDGHGAQGPHGAHWREGLGRVLGNHLTWPGFFVNLGVSGSFFAFAGLWAVPLLTHGYGLSRAAATAHTSLMLAGFALGAFFIGTLSDRLGRRKPVMAAAVGMYVLCWLPLALGAGLTPGWSHGLFFLMGAGASGFTLTWACAKEVNPLPLSGMATSVVNTGAFLGSGILQPLVGWAIDRAALAGSASSLGDYRTGMTILLGAALSGLFAVGAVRETRCRGWEASQDGRL